MKYAETSITIAELRATPPKVQAAYLAIGQIHNDMSVLFKLIIRMTATPRGPDVVEAGKIAMSSFFTRMAAGRLYEAWKTLNSTLNAIEKTFGLVSKMEDETQQHWQSLKKYFSNSNPIKTVRNRLAFHGDTDQILDQLKDYPADFVLQDFHFEHIGNCLFGSAEIAQLAAVQNILKTDDPVQAFDELSKQILVQTKSVIEVCWGFQGVFLSTFFPEKLKGQTLKDTGLSFESIRTPLQYHYVFFPQQQNEAEAGD